MAEDDHSQHTSVHISGDQLQVALSGAGLAALDWDIATEIIAWVGCFDKLVGFEQGGFDGTVTTLEKRIHPDDVSALRLAVQKSCDERALLSHTFRVVLSTGGVRWLSIRGKPVYTHAEQSVRIVGVLIDVTSLQTAEEAMRQRALVSSLFTAQEEERRSIAYDLHDGLTQYVMGAYAFLQVFQKAFADGRTQKASNDLAQGLKCLKEAVIESRRLVNGLRALALEDMGLEGALGQLVLEEKARAGWQEADFYHNIAGQHFDITLETAVYRIAQEALTNARKYADAQKVRITLLYEKEEQSLDSRLILDIRDWGKGFDPEQIRMDSSRAGLHGISERARLLNGRMDIHSEPGSGTALNIVFPCKSRKEDGG